MDRSKEIPLEGWFDGKEVQLEHQLLAGQHGVGIQTNDTLVDIQDHRIATIRQLNH